MHLSMWSLNPSPSANQGIYDKWKWHIPESPSSLVLPPSESPPSSCNCQNPQIDHYQIPHFPCTTVKIFKYVRNPTLTLALSEFWSLIHLLSDSNSYSFHGGLIIYYSFINIWFAIRKLNKYILYAKQTAGLSKDKQASQSVKWNEMYKWKDSMKYQG